MGALACLRSSLVQPGGKNSGNLFWCKITKINSTKISSAKISSFKVTHALNGNLSK